MRRLLLMRHAKSAWSTGATTDHDRPLKRRGREDAATIARTLVVRGYVPDAVVSSDSERTRETWACMSEHLPAVPVLFTRELYQAGMGELRSVLRQQDPARRTVLALGHNPGWEDALVLLCGEAATLGTATTAVLLGEGATWDEALAEPGSWRLVELLSP